MAKPSNKTSLTHPVEINYNNWGSLFILASGSILGLLSAALCHENNYMERYTCQYTITPLATVAGAVAGGYLLFKLGFAKNVPLSDSKPSLDRVV